MGSNVTTEGDDNGDNGTTDVTSKVKFGKAFERTPKVIASIAAFWRIQAPDGTTDKEWGLIAQARNPTTTSFDLYVQAGGTKIKTLTVVWIACE